MPQSLKKRAAEMERRIAEHAEVVKRLLKEYRETARASGGAVKGTAQPRSRTRLLKKRLDVERATAEYVQLQKELDQLRSRMQTGKSS
ncbi:MAG TPA: hypothetical protein VNO70_05960 [Blastocatellia bacterium]|nr:hypothetical protein [Blastocatellia bacterium]